MNINKINNVAPTYDKLVNQDTTQTNQKKNLVNVEEGAVYEGRSQQSMVTGLYTAAAKSTSNQYEDYYVQGDLTSLGFYNGTIDGNLTSESCRKAISHFQNLYGLTETGYMNDSTRTKLSAVMETRSNCCKNDRLKNIINNKDFSLDNSESNTLLNVYTFLRNGMGLNAKQAAGVCGNIMSESRFSANNAQDGYYDGDHNYDYPYANKDGIGYGLLQWTFHTRKEGLKDMADSWGVSVSDQNVQLAFFKKEMGSNDFKSGWAAVKKATTVKGACDAFLEKIENPAVYNYDERRGYANTIYDQFKLC